RRRAVGSRGRPAAGGASAAGKGKPARGSAGPAAGRPQPGHFPEVEELVELMDRHGLLEVDFQTAPDGSRRIRVSRAGAAAQGAPAPHARPAEAATGAAHAGGHAAAPAEKLHAF